MPKPKKMLSDCGAPYMQSLMSLIVTQSESTLAHWAINYAEQILLPLWNRDYPEDPRPQQALKVARECLSGAAGLPQAKEAVLACRTAAREADAQPAAQAAARAIGQCVSTIHSAGQCIGLPLYGALAVAYDALGTSASWEQLERRAAEECGRMLGALQAVSVDGEPNPAKINWTC